MNYTQCCKLIDFLNKRFREAKMQTGWEQWGIEITWGKLKKWSKMLGS